MKLSDAQLKAFERDGLLILPNLFLPAEVERLKAPLPAIFAESTDANIREKESGVVRTAMGLHLRNEVYAKLVRHPRFVEPAQQIRGPALYIQQVKVNVKAAFEGEAWQWHYDFATHHNDDGAPEPLALNLHVFLDDVSEFNGPLHFILGSHEFGPAPTRHDTTSTNYPLWVVDKDVVERLARQGRLVSAKGRAGTALIFGDTLVHCSPPNMSPWNRAIFSLILNPLANRQTKFARPDYKHHRDFTPVAALGDDCLLEARAAE